MLDQILHIQKVTCHLTKKIMEGILFLWSSYRSFCSPIYHYREAMNMLGLKWNPSKFWSTPRPISSAVYTVVHIQVYSVHIDAQLDCQWFLLIAVLWPFLSTWYVGCWTTWKKSCFQGLPKICWSKVTKYILIHLALASFHPHSILHANTKIMAWGASQSSKH